MFWLLKRVGRPVMHQVWYWFIMAVDLWSLLLSTKETNRKVQNAWYMYAATCTQSWYRCQAFLGLKHTCSLTILGTAAAQIWLDTFYTGHAGLVLCQLALSKQAGPARHGSAQLAMMLASFGHVYTATANCAGLYWYRPVIWFQVAV